MDFVQWTAPSPTQDPANWQEIAYKQDVTGRRVEKKVDGYSTRYVYDGEQVVAEYDGNNNLLRKYIYGPGIDQPVSMTEVADANATYYYHFDALGSVVALSNATGDTVQTYEYSVYGEVAVEDANHPNPYMFAGVRYDIEIGLYYNRARYYNPFTGRFLQTDPANYKYGMNLYAYCGNRPSRFTDPSGLGPCPVCGDEGGSCQAAYARDRYNDPCWTVTTGDIMILPYLLDPGKVMAIEGLTAYLEAVRTAMGWSGTVGLSIDLWHQDWAKVAGGVADPAGYLVDKYLEFMGKMASAILQAAYNETHPWRAFFEVQDYRWKMKDGEYVLDDRGNRIKEKLGNPYWIEVLGLEGWIEGAGYASQSFAITAAIRGRDFFYCNAMGHSAPRAWYDDGLSPAGGDIYGSRSYTGVLPGGFGL